jgi:membrane-associated protease RseP (regulator of RpoE activity)
LRRYGDTGHERADIVPGDRIVSVANHHVDTWEQFDLAIGARPNREVTLGLLRNGLEATRVLTPTVLPGQSRFEIGDIGVLPNVHPHLLNVNAGEPGARGGLTAGDVIVADADGVVCIPAAFLDTVLAEGPEQERLEAWIMTEVDRGVPLPGLYPMNAETKARYAASKK